MENHDFKEMFELYRKQLEHEDNLINARITWYLLLQTAFSAFYTVIIKDFPKNQSQPSDSIRTYLAILVFSGILLTIYTFISIIAAAKASDYLADQCETILKEWHKWQTEKIHQNLRYYQLPIPKFSRGGGSAFWHKIGFWFGPWGFLFFGILWLYLLYEHFSVIFPFLLKAIGCLLILISGWRIRVELKDKLLVRQIWKGAIQILKFFEFRSRSRNWRLCILSLLALMGVGLMVQQWLWIISVGVCILVFVVYDLVRSWLT